MLAELVEASFGSSDSNSAKYIPEKNHANHADFLSQPYRGYTASFAEIYAYLCTFQRPGFPLRQGVQRTGK
jgi:hypothetical protein